MWRNSHLRRYMWYLSEQLVGLVFFDDSVSLTKKRDILKASAEQEGSEDPPCRVTVDTREAAFTNKTITADKIDEAVAAHEHQYKPSRFRPGCLEHGSGLLGCPTPHQSPSNCQQLRGERSCNDADI